MTLEDFTQSVSDDTEPPEELSPELTALWFAKNDRWEEAHYIAQDIPTALGSWIHALLHLIEGDISNAGYWYQRAGQPSRGPDEIDAEWKRIAEAATARG